MKRLLFILILPLLCSLALGQGVVVSPKVIKSPGIVVSPGSAIVSNPSLITDVTNPSFCEDVTTCVTSNFTPTTGDLLLVFEYAGGSAASVSAPTDNCGGTNTYTSVATNSASGAHSALYWAIVGTGGSSCHVTGNYGGTLTGVSAQTYVQDWRGVNATTPVYSAAIGNVNTPGTGPNAISSSFGTGSTISGTQTNNDIAGGVVTCYGNADAFSAGTGYTLGAIHENVGNCNVAGEYEALTAAASGVSATFTTTGGTNNYYNTFAAVIQHP
jgi:hypothetical protein